MKTFISVIETWFRPFATDRSRSVDYCFDGKVLEDDQIEPPGVPTKKYKVYEELE